MRWSNVGTVVVLAALVGFVVGSIVGLASSALLSQPQAQAVLAFTVLLVFIVTVLVAKSQRWLSNPYW